MINKPSHFDSARFAGNQLATSQANASSPSLLTLRGWRCAIRNPLLRRASALLFGLYLVKGLAWLGFAAWLWWRAT